MKNRLPSGFEHVEQQVGDQFCIGDDRQLQKINEELTTTGCIVVGSV